MPKMKKPIKLGTITRKQIAAYMGRRGGKASAKALTAEARKERAKHAVKARELKRKQALKVWLGGGGGVCEECKQAAETMDQEKGE